MPFSTDLPTPPVPADCDLRGLPYYPLSLQRLVRSTFHNQASPAEWKAGLLLWMKSWDQMPSGSLPNNDRELASLAEVRDVRAWLKLKEVSLHGWELHSDGRFYHPVVTEVALHAWKLRKVNRRRGTAGAEARWTPMRQACSEDAPSMRHGCVADGKLEVEDSVPSSEDANASPEKATGADAPTENAPSMPVDPIKQLWDRGLVIVGASHRALLGKMAKAYGQPAVLAAIVECEREQPVDPAAYFVACCKRNRNGGGTPLANLFEGAWRVANEADERDRQEQSGDHGADRGPPHALLDRR